MRLKRNVLRRAIRFNLRTTLALGIILLAPAPKSMALPPICDSRVTLNFGSQAYNILTADLDGDTDFDLAVSSYNTDDVCVMVNDGSGTFVPAGCFPVGSNPEGIKAADFDHDGDNDIIVALHGGGRVILLTNDGTGNFTHSTVAVIGAAHAVLVADLNGDETLDVAVSDDASNKVYILKGNGDGTFVLVDIIDVLQKPTWIAAGDLDADDDLDLVVTNDRSEMISILENNGDGTMQTPVVLPAGVGQAWSVVIAELNGVDGLDLAVTSSGSGEIWVYLRNFGVPLSAVNAFQSAVPYPVGNAPNVIVAKDLDQDGDEDLVIALGTGNVSMLENNGDGTFQAAVICAAGSGSIQTVSADFDFDGDFDLATVNHGDNTVTIHFNELDPEVDIPCAQLYTFTGEAADDALGWSVSSAGDFDGDGYDDIVIGAWRSDAGGSPETGQVYVFSGRTGDTLYNITGEQSGNELGGATNGVSGIGDFNGDGYDDIVISARFYSGVGSNSGRAYVFLGGPGPYPVSTGASNADMIINGASTGDRLGYSTSGAGDVNGDSYDDFIIGATQDYSGGTAVGRAYVFFGGPGPLPSALSASAADIILKGEAAGHFFGLSVAGASDINADGFDDILVGAPQSATGGTGGRAYVFLGGSGPYPKSVLASNADMTFSGESAGDRFGESSSHAGDINADGYADLVVGAPYNDAGNTDAGRAYVFLGSSVFPTVRTASTADIIFEGSVANGWLGTIVSGVGDVNCDGAHDLLISATPWDYASPNDSGHAFLFLGGFGPYPASVSASSADIVFTGEAVGDLFGGSSSGVGDVNGDGCEDLIIGAPKNDAGGADAGRAYVYTCNFNQPPIAVCQDITIAAGENCTADASIDDGSFDPDGDPIVNTQVPAGPYPIGTTLVSLTVTDDNGSSSTCEASVTVTEGQSNIAGNVSTFCNGSSGYELAVPIDIFDSLGNLVASTNTTSDGSYLIGGLPSGQSYTVGIIPPLGFSADFDEQVAAVLCGDTTIVDFILTCVEISSNPRTIGFWKHQLGVALGGNGQGQVDAATLCGYLDMIAGHFNSNEINQVIVYNPPASGVCSDKLQVAKDLLNLKGNVSMISRAKQQLTALMMNVAAGYISQTEIISADGATVSQAITYCDNLIDDPNGDHEKAKTICDDINNNIQVLSGVIPLSTTNIAYRNAIKPDEYALLQNFPNPFNPTTEINFHLPSAADVLLEVFNITGQKVVTLVDEYLESGFHTVAFDGTRVASGVYLYRLTSGEFIETKKMLLLK